jgi:membrane protein DedA with SNARE-associated domain
MLENFYGYIFHLFQTVDYGGIFAMMLIEASMLPFPSEVPLMAIGIQAAKGTMNPLLGFLISLIAIFIGASLNYAIGRFVGDTFFEKYGRYFLIKKHAYHEAKKLYKKDATFYTFYGRLMPLVRQLMSLPAGMVHMPFMKFMALTLSGSAIWHGVLITL